MLESEVIKCVEKSSYNGIGLITLSIKTKVPQSDLRFFLDNNPDFFTKNPKNNRYTLNRFGLYKGESTDMLNELYRVNAMREKSNRDFYWFYVPIIILLVLYFLYFDYLK